MNQYSPSTNLTSLNHSLAEKIASTKAILIYLSLFKFILVLIFSGNYGLFRDEYYYIETSRHLDWGFVDLQPLPAIILAFSRAIFGDSMFGIRVFSFIAGSVLVFISGLIARELNGSRFAQIFTAFIVIFSGVLLGNSSYFSMNSFDILLSALMFYYLIRLINTDNQKLWIVLGLIFGIGLQNKLTFLFLGFGLAVGLILTKYRNHLLKKELWIGVLIALLIFLPNIIWQIVNDFPTFEFMRNASLYKNRPMGIIDFTLNSLLELNPGYTIFLLAALYFLFFNKHGKKYIIIGWIFLSVFIVFVFNNAKPYYMGVLYPVMLAAGVLGADYLIEKYMKNYARIILVLIIAPFAFVVTPFAIPVLSVDDFIKYSEMDIMAKPENSERAELGKLPQFFADRFGWEEMVQKVALVYNTLSDEEKKEVLIFGQNYGEAGAVNYFRQEYNLPPAISAHNNYWIWGYPQNFSGNILIVIGSNIEDNSKYFEEVILAEKHFSKYGMPFENVDIFICKKPKMPISEIWNRIKVFI